MSDATEWLAEREALVALLWEKFGAGPNGPLAAWLTEADCARFADAILAEFDVTPRGENATPLGLPIPPENVFVTTPEKYEAFLMLVEEADPPTTLPPAEDVARRHSRVSMDGTCICGAVGIGFTLGYGEHLVAETLALLPGRIEAEVKAEAWDEGASAADPDWFWHDGGRTCNPYRKEADRG